MKANIHGISIAYLSVISKVPVIPRNIPLLALFKHQGSDRLCLLVHSKPASDEGMVAWKTQLSFNLLATDFFSNFSTLCI